MPRLVELAPAAALGALTLSTFFVLQDYGPESAIRRFHQAIAERDLQELAKVTEQEINTNAVAQLVWRVRSIDPTAQNYRLLRTDRSSREVRVEVGYRTPPGYVVVLPWIVQKTGSAWRVDAIETLGWMQRYLFPGARW